MNISCTKKVAQIMSGAPVTVDVNSPLSDAAEKMEQKIISSLPILP